MKITSVLRLAFVAAALAGCSTLARAETADNGLPPADHYVYLSFLPSASDLTQDARINRLEILQLIEQPDHVIVTYRYPDGHVATLGYARRGTTVASAPPPARRVVTTTPPPEVVYVERPYPYQTQVVYTDPWYGFWAPLTVGFGIGWATSYYGHGHYHGGYHGHYHGHGGHGHY